jgi:hypothetical protein
MPPIPSSTLEATIISRVCLRPRFCKRLQGHAWWTLHGFFYYTIPSNTDTVPYLLLMNMDAIELQQLTPSSQVGRSNAGFRKHEVIPSHCVLLLVSLARFILGPKLRYQKKGTKFLDCDHGQSEYNLYAALGSSQCVVAQYLTGRYNDYPHGEFTISKKRTILFKDVLGRQFGASASNQALL